MATARSISATQRRNNLETFSIVWLDELVSDTVEFIDAQQRLRASINRLVTFKDKDECEQHIQQVSKEDRIVLIASDHLGQQIVPRIHQLRQVSAIYIYCTKKLSEDWTKKFRKVKNVIVKLDQLITQIVSDQEERSRNKVNEPLSISIFNTSGQEQSTTRLNGEFVHSQLLIDCLLRMKSSPEDVNELISQCEEEYNGNNQELGILREFKQDYKADRALWWYTRDSFIYRQMNKALRVQNIDLLFLFRFLIHDIRHQLQVLQCTSSICVFRGQLMSNGELELLKNSIGQIISMNSFLSTSLEREMARFYLGALNDYSGEDERVLFEIDADPRLKDIKPFANITMQSYFGEEKEVLIMLGSIFRLVSVAQDEDHVWIIRMTLCSDNDHDVKTIYEHMKKQYGDGYTNLGSFGIVLGDMGKFDEAEKYFLRLLKELPNDHKDISVSYHNLGRVASAKGCYALSIQYYKKSLEIEMQTLKTNDPRIASSHINIGAVYQETGDNKRALESYNKALEIYISVFGENHLDVAMCYGNIGNVYYVENNYSDALTHHQKALAIQEKHLPVDDPKLGASHSNIGLVHLRRGHLDIALEHFECSRKIYERSHTSRHPHVANTLANIGLTYERKGELQQARSYLEQAATIYRYHNLPPIHPNVVQVNEHILRISALLGLLYLINNFRQLDAHILKLFNIDK